MTTLLENPIPILVVGVIAEIILAAIFLSNRRAVWLAAMAGVLLLTLLGVLIERLVVTPREEVELALNGLAEALQWQTADKEAKKAKVLGYLSPSASQTRARAAWALDRYGVTSARVRNLEVTVNELTSPPTANAEFQGVITLKDGSGQIPDRPIPVQFTAKLRKEGGRWLVAEHSEEVARLGKIYEE